MSFEALIPGMRFASKHNLSQKEIQLIALFIKKPDRSYTIPELSKLLGANKKTLHTLIQRLRLKSLLVLKNREINGTNLYELDVSSLKE